MNLPLDLLISVFLLGVLGLAVAYARKDGRKRTSPEATEARNALFATAVNESPDKLLQLLTRAGRPLADTALIQSQTESRSYASLRRKLHAGRTFAGSVEVYLSTQLAGIIIASVIVLVAFALGLESITLGLAALVAAMVAYYPWDKVSRSARKRIEAVEDQLPDFAEMLIIPLTSGLTVLQSMQFVAEQLHGPVADEVLEMTARIDSRSMSVDAAFELAAESLGTDAARTLFQSLLQADRTGARVASNLALQASALRTEAFQRQRGRNRKLPVQLVLIFALHFLPLLLVVVLVPVLISLGQV